MERLISIFRNIKETKQYSALNIVEVLKSIQSGSLFELNDLFNKVVDVRNATGKQRDALKMSVPYFTPAGTFNPRKDAGLKEFSGIIQIDIDRKHNEHLASGVEDFGAAVRDMFISDEHTFAAFKSVGGSGCCVLFITDNTAKEFKETYAAISAYILKKYEIVTDSAVDSISEARFFSLDFDLFLNENAIPFNEKIKIIPQVKKATANKVQSNGSDFVTVLNKIVERNTDLTNGEYDTWLRLGFAISSEFGEAGREYFHSVSQFNEKYNPTDCDKQFDACLKSGKKEGGVTIAYFFKKAQEFGIVYKSSAPKVSIEVLSENTSEETESGVLSAFIASKGVYFDVITRGFFWGRKVMEDTDKNDLYLLCINCLYGGEQKKLKRGFFDTVLNSSGIPRRNMITEFLETLPQRTGTATIDLFISGIPVADQDADIAKDFIKRWLVGIIANMYLLEKFDSGEEFEVSPLMLLLCEPRGGTGKSEFFKRLLPKELSKLFYTTQLDDLNIKDEYIKMTQNVICLLDEIDQMLIIEKKVNFIKYVTAQDIFDVRAPYKSTTEKRPKLAVFGATSNPSDILLKSEGNRRIIPVQITKALDWDLHNSISRTELFAELKSLYDSGYQWRIIGDDIRRLEQLSSGFVAPNAPMEMLAENYEPDPTSPAKSLTSIINGLPFRLPPIDNIILAKFADAAARLGWVKDGRKGYRVKRNF